MSRKNIQTLLESLNIDYKKDEDDYANFFNLDIH